MREEIKDLNVYHGTSSKIAKCIKQNGFKMSPTGWLGKGIYFFHNNSDLARDWAAKKYRNERVEVIERNIKVENEKIFDMVDPDEEDNKLFHKLRLDLVRKSQKECVRCNLSRENFEE